MSGRRGITVAGREPASTAAAGRTDLDESSGSVGRRVAGATAIALTGALLLAAAFRLPVLDRVPNGLFLDEASRGYDAFALLRTGADQYGVRWPLFPEGIDDFTPVLYTLLALPSVAALGLTETAVRLPATLAGVATVATTFLCGRALVGRRPAVVAALLVAISPWHILPSRTGAEWALLPLFTTTGLWLLARGRQHGPALLGAGLVLGVGLYSYAFARLLVPLLVVGFAALWWRDLARQWRWALAGGLILAACATPLVQFALTPAGQARLQAVVPLDRYQGWALLPYALANYASYFGPGFLIWGSEPTHHHRVAGLGPVLPIMAPLALAGLVATARRPMRGTLFVLWWLAVAPASAALHRESPSSALLLGAIPAWQLVCGVGAAWLVDVAERWRAGAGRLLAGAALIGGLATAVLVGRALYVEYPVYAADDWLFGSRETIAYLEANRAAYDDVLVSDRLPTPHVLVLFFGAPDPLAYQRAPIHVRQPNVRSRGQIGQYQFGRIRDLLDRPGNHLVWVTADEGRELFGESPPLLTVRLPDGRPTMLVYASRRR